MPYRIEVTPNNRAGCQDSVCKYFKAKILKGELRLGTWVEIPDRFASWRWRHWGCTSGQTIKHLQEATDADGTGEYDFDAIDGYDEIQDESVKEKIRRCIEQGHIDPEDWRGDPEFNELGKKGIRSNKSIDRLKHPEKYENDNEEAEKESEESIPKVGTKRSKKVADDSDNSPEEQNGKRNKASIKGKEKKRKAVDSDEEQQSQPASKRTKGRKEAITAMPKAEPSKLEETEEAIMEPKPVAKRGKGRASAATTNTALEPSKSEEVKKEISKPARKSKGNKKEPTSTVSDIKNSKAVTKKRSGTGNEKREVEDKVDTASTPTESKGRRRSGRTTNS